MSNHSHTSEPQGKNRDGPGRYPGRRRKPPPKSKPEQPKPPPRQH